MILTCDVGNSNIVTVIYDDEMNILFKKRSDTIKENVEQGYRLYFEEITDSGFDFEITYIVVSCVVFVAKEALVKAIDYVFSCPSLFISADLLDDFRIMLDDRREIGADLLATAYGAMNKYPLPCIIADVGSVTKITVVSKSGAFMGGVIMPGIAISADAMHRFIPQLPKVKLSVPDKVIGTETGKSIQSGILFGAVDGICGVADRIEKEMSEPCQRVITGGFSALIHSYCEGFIWDNNLLNDGLFNIYQAKGSRHEE